MFVVLINQNYYKMTKQDLIRTAKVTLTDRGERTIKGDVVKTMIIEFETGYRSEWCWTVEEDCTPDLISYRIGVDAANAYAELHKNCAKTPCEDCMQEITDAIKSSDFAYARFKSSGLGNYYSIYHRNDDSPTGVKLASSCSEETWEKVSSETKNAHNYFSPTESKMTAR